MEEEGEAGPSSSNPSCAAVAFPNPQSLSFLEVTNVKLNQKTEYISWGQWLSLSNTESEPLGLARNG